MFPEHTLCHARDVIEREVTVRTIMPQTVYSPLAFPCLHFFEQGKIATRRTAWNEGGKQTQEFYEQPFWIDQCKPPNTTQDAVN